MLSGKRPDECNYCWNVEDNSTSYSDRTFKSSEQWSWDEFDSIKKSNLLSYFLTASINEIILSLFQKNL